jgi:acyl carrier protein
MNDHDVFTTIRDVIIATKADIIAIQPEEIQMESELTEFPLAMDSIDFVGMIIGIEEAFGIIAEDEDFLGSSMITVANVVDVVKRRLCSPDMQGS